MGRRPIPVPQRFGRDKIKPPKNKPAPPPAPPEIRMPAREFGAIDAPGGLLPAVLILDDPDKFYNRQYAEIERLHAELNAPIPMLLFCPQCAAQHIDTPHGNWTNPPHKTHECQFCHWRWRPCDRPTMGVKDIKTGRAIDATPTAHFDNEQS